MHVRPAAGRNLHDHPMVEVEHGVASVSSGRSRPRSRQAVPDEQTLGKACSSLAGEVYDLHLVPFFSATQTGILAGRVSIAAAVMTPRSRGAVRVRSADPAAAPWIDHAYLEDPDGHDLAVPATGSSTSASSRRGRRSAI